MNNKNKLYGVNGFLLLFIVGLVGISPLVSMVRLYNNISLAEHQYPSLVSNNTWSNYVFCSWYLFIAMTIWQWIVGHYLLSSFEPSSIKKVKTLLIFLPAIYLLKELFFSSPIGMGDIIQSYFPPLIWYMYFTYSKKVRITYLEEDVILKPNQLKNTVSLKNENLLEQHNFDTIKTSIKSKKSLQDIYNDFFNDIEKEMISFEEFKTLCKKLYYK